MRKYSKIVIIFISILVNVILWQNCSVGFDSSSFSSGSGTLSSEFDEIPGVTPGDTTSPSLISKLDKNYINPDLEKHLDPAAKANNEFKFACQSPAGELVEFMPSKMSSLEINNTVQNILGITIKSEDVYPGQDTSNFFSSSNNFAIEDTLLINLDQLSEGVANSFILSLQQNKNDNFNCNFSADCFNKIVTELPFYLWRRPLSTNEQTTITQVIGAPNTNAERQSSLHNLVTFLIQSPQFFTKNTTKVATAAGVNQFDLYEFASRLSFFITYSGPSIDLLNQIRSGQITTVAALQGYADQLLNDDSALKLISRHFFGGWLTYKDYLNDDSPFSGATLRQHSLTLEDNIFNILKADLPAANIFNPQDSKDSYFTSKIFANSTTAKSEFSRIVIRGLTITENINCFDFPELDEATIDVIVAVQQSDSFPHEGSPSEQLEYHRLAPQCASCHQHIDEQGAGLLWINGFGDFRPNYDDGKIIDHVGKIGNEDFNSLDEYLFSIARTADIEACFANRLHQKLMPTPHTHGTHGIKPCLTDELFGDQVYGMDKGLKTIFKNFISSNVFQNYKTPSSVVRATGGNKREISSAAEILPVVIQPVTPQPAEPNPVNPAPAGSISSLANSGECTVVASTLSDARSKFEDQCRNQRREDCDQIRGQWLCSNISEPKQATPERQL